MPRISVVLPAYNGAAYIEETLNCLFNQDYSNIEIIVVDDGSTDDTRYILEKYQGRIRLITQENRGHVMARNAGFRAMSGTLVGTIDQDDLWPTNHVSRMASFLEPESMYDYVRGRVQIFGDTVPASVQSLAAFMPALMGACLFRAHVFETVGFLDEHMSAGDDVDWVARLAASGLREKRIDDVMLYYRRHGNNTSSRPEFMKKGMFHALRNRIKRG